MNNHHGNASRKPNTKKYEENFDKIDWDKNKLTWGNPERTICQKRAQKASQWLRRKETLNSFQNHNTNS
uniref:Uncharacterized protein n=1 Tax=viral metagenome TaxID=1070528 RepID=A0A6H1ZGC7_9ZZZZ